MHSDKLFDTRIVERNVKKGLLTKKDYEKHLSGMKDLSGEFEVIEVTSDELSGMPKTEEYKD